MQTFGEQLTAARKAKGMTQEELALAVNVARNTISSWERGRTIPDIDTARRLSDVLGADLTQTGEGQNKAPATETTPPEAQPSPTPRNEEIPRGVLRRAKKPWIIAGAVVLVCIVLLSSLLLSRKPAPADDGTAFNIGAYQQETPNEAGKAYITFENSRRDENIGDNTYSIYDFKLCEQNGIGFKITSAEISMESAKSDTARTMTLAPEELEQAGFGSVIEPYGTLSINGGWPKGEFRRVGIAVRGTDDTGAALAFYSMIEF